ncbi:MAG: methyltransferase domain-containing protein [Solirubrobacteraceae bacterium]
MTGGILFIASGEELQRQVFETEGRAAWSDALPLVLEKHGFLALETAGPEALREREVLEGADVVLIGRLPEGCWGAEQLATIAEIRTPLLIDGPLPPQLASQLDIAVVEAEGEHEPSILAVADRELSRALGRYAPAGGGRISSANCVPLEIRGDLLWESLAEVPITAEQARVWRECSLDVQLWGELGAATRLCDLVDDSRPELSRPAIARRAGVVACSFDFFSLLVHRHTAEPIDGSQWRRAQRTLGLEAVLLGIVDLLHQEANAVRARVLPWPHGRQLVQVIRHPVDEPADTAAVREQLDRLKEREQAATWFWAPSAIEPDQISLVRASERQEIALSGELLWAGERDEIGALQAAGATRVTGLSSRPSSLCFRYQGAPNVLWAERFGLRYVDLPARSHMHPHRFPVLERDGTIRPAGLLCIPGTESVPLLEREGLLTRRLEEWRSAHGMLSLEMPIVPMAGDPLGRIEVGANDITDWTLQDAVSWWEKTHVAGALVLRALGNGYFEASAKEPVDQVTLGLLLPRGEEEIVTHDLTEEPVAVGRRVDEPRGPAPWEGTFEAISVCLDGYWQSRPSKATESARTALLRRNTVQVPGRLGYLTSLLAELTGHTGWEGLTVLLPHSGFGTLNCLMAMQYDPYLVIGMEAHQPTSEAAAQIVAALGLEERVETLKADFPDLNRVESGSVDVLVADNILHAVHHQNSLRGLLREVHRVLRPGGHLLVYETLRGPQAKPDTDLPPRFLRHRLRKGGFHDPEIIRYGPEGRLSEEAAESDLSSFALAAKKDARRVEPVVLRRRPPRRPRLETWVRSPEQIAEVFAPAVGEALSVDGRDPSAPAAQATIRTNSVLVPGRGDHLLGLMGQLLGRDSITGARVLEVGSGYGALAAYLAWRERPVQLIGIDVSESYVEFASRCAAELALDPILSFRRVDMRDLSEFEDAAFDFVFANNSFIYVPDRAGGARALSEMHRVLAPGGAAIFYQANLWRWSEPFTGDPLIHLLPGPVAQAISRLTGAQHNHGRVRLASPGAMKRSLRRTGFAPTHPVGFRSGPRTNWPARNLGSFFGIAGRKA